MNCQTFESIVNELARDQIMEATVREQAVLHSDSCDMCSARLREEQILTKGLRELSVRMQADAASERVEASLIAEFRAKRVSGQSFPEQSVIGGAGEYRRRYWAYAAVAAAVIVVALAITAMRLGGASFSPKSRETSPPPELVKDQDPQPPDNPQDRDLQAKQGGSTDRVLRRNPRRFAKQNAASRVGVAKNTVTVQSLDILPANYDEVTTGFIPIAYSNASNVQEGGQLMRLELPRYAMARFGLPINVDRYDERVKADVWVGTDGVARAIRFVQ